jgi:hypothetical protein
MSSRSESTLASLIIIGFACIVIGGIMFFMGFAGGAMQLGSITGVRQQTSSLAILGLVLGLAGLVLLGFAVFSGLFASKMQSSGPRRFDPNAKVVARYAMGKNGDMALSDWEWDYEGMRFFVRLSTSDRQAAEYECARPVFEQCGEGMVGEAMFQGKWLGGFRPHIGGTPAAPPPVGHDPLRM